MSERVEEISLETIRKTESFIDKNYHGLMQISSIYVKFGEKHRIFSILQLLFANSIMTVNSIVLMRSSYFILDVNFSIFTQSIHISLLALLSMSFCASFLKNRKSFFFLHSLMANDFYDYGEPILEAVKVMTEKILWERKFLSMVPVSVLVTTGTILFVAPILDRRYGTFDFNTIANITSANMPYAFAVYPYKTSEGFGYYFTFALQLTFGFIITISTASVCYVYIVISQSFILQLKILLLSLENIEERAIDLCAQLFSFKYNSCGNAVYEKSEFAYCYSICLRKNFEHHQILLRFFNNFTKFFSTAVFLYYCMGSIIIALSLLSTSTSKELPGTTAASAILIFAEVGFMYIFSSFAQRISDLSMELRFKIYSVKWYYCNEYVTKTILIFQTFTLRPMSLNAGGIVPANMDTFARVINSAYSYYNLVNAFEIK